MQNQMTKLRPFGTPFVSDLQPLQLTRRSAHGIYKVYPSLRLSRF